MNSQYRALIILSIRFFMEATDGSARHHGKCICIEVSRCSKAFSVTIMLGSAKSF